MHRGQCRAVDQPPRVADVLQDSVNVPTDRVKGKGGTPNTDCDLNFAAKHGAPAERDLKARLQAEPNADGQVDQDWTVVADDTKHPIFSTCLRLETGRVFAGGAATAAAPRRAPRQRASAPTASRATTPSTRAVAADARRNGGRSSECRQCS